MTDAELELLLDLHAKAGVISYREPANLNAKAFFDAAKASVPVLVDLCRDSAINARLADESTTMLRSVREYPSRLVAEWRQTAQAERENGRAEFAEAMEICAETLAKAL